MMTADPRPRSQEFITRTERGAFVLVCDDLYNDKWWMEWRDRDGKVLHQIPWAPADLPELHLQIRNAHRLEHPDLDPDFHSLGERHAIGPGGDSSTDLQEIELTWIFYALGRALQRKTPGDSEFLSEIAEASATFLEEEGPYFCLAHPKRRRHGRPADRYWDMMTKPVQEAMNELVGILLPELVTTIASRRDSVSSIEQLLLEKHADPLQQFSERIIRSLMYRAGFDSTELPPELRGQMNAGRYRDVAYIDVFEKRVVRSFALRILSLPNVHSISDLPPTLRLDSSNPEDVRWILRQALGVLFGSNQTRSMLRSFRLPLSRR